MKKKSLKHSAFFQPRVFIGFVLLFAASVLALTGFGIAADAPPRETKLTAPSSDPSVSAKPDVIEMVGPFSEDRDLNDIPYVLPNMEEEPVRLMRHRSEERRVGKE